MLQYGCVDHWTWNEEDKSVKVKLYDGFKKAQFHPHWSYGTAGVRGTKPFNSGQFYWELRTTEKVYGTSIMFGVGTKKVKLHTNAFVHMLGQDRDSWGLSHNGSLWHNGVCRQYTTHFPEGEATTIGLHFDADRGILSYFKDGIDLGVAFSTMNISEDPLYPIICSTAARTEITLSSMRRSCINLQDFCRAEILRKILRNDKIELLHLPKRIKRYLTENDE